MPADTRRFVSFRACEEFEKNLIKLRDKFKWCFVKQVTLGGQLTMNLNYAEFTEMFCSDCSEAFNLFFDSYNLTLHCKHAS